MWALNHNARRGREVYGKLRNYGRYKRKMLLTDDQLYKSCYYVTPQVFNIFQVLYTDFFINPADKDWLDNPYLPKSKGDPNPEWVNTPEGTAHFAERWKQWITDLGTKQPEVVDLLDWEKFMGMANFIVSKRLRGKQKEIEKGTASMEHLEQLWHCFSTKKESSYTKTYLSHVNFKNMVEHVRHDAIVTSFDRMALEKNYSNWN